MARPSMPVGTYSNKIEARPQMIDAAGRYKTAPAGTPKRKIARWRAQGSVRDFTGRTSALQRFGATKTEAERNLREALEERLSAVEGEELKPTTTVADAAAAWLEDARSKGKLTQGSLRVYALAVSKHIKGTEGEPGKIAALKLREVTAPRVERALQAVADSAGDGMAKTTRTVLRNVFAFAVYQSAMSTNPVTDVRPVRATKSEDVKPGARDTQRAFTEVELALVLSLAESEPRAQARDLADLLYFLAGTGVRIGEALALKWADVSLDASPATIRIGGTTVHRSKGKGLAIVEHGSTKRHERVLPLSNSLANRLRVRRERIAMLDNPYGVVFLNALGGSLRDPSNVAHHVRDLLNAAGMPWATAHTFRRTVATRLHDAGLTDREVSNFVGHAKVSMAQDVYLDRRQPVTEIAAQVLDRPVLQHAART